jgi:hypothetical protein
MLRHMSVSASNWPALLDNNNTNTHHHHNTVPVRDIVALPQHLCQHSAYISILSLLTRGVLVGQSVVLQESRILHVINLHSVSIQHLR